MPCEKKEEKKSHSASLIKLNMFQTWKLYKLEVTHAAGIWLLMT